MLGCANIKSDVVNIVATIQGAATKIILNDETYEKKYGENPNTKVIEFLSNYGGVICLLAQLLTKQIKHNNKKYHRSTVSLQCPVKLSIKWICIDAVE